MFALGSGTVARPAGGRSTASARRSTSISAEAESAPVPAAEPAEPGRPFLTRPIRLAGSGRSGRRCGRTGVGTQTEQTADDELGVVGVDVLQGIAFEHEVGRNVHSFEHIGDADQIRSDVSDNERPRRRDPRHCSLRPFQSLHLLGQCRDVVDFGKGERDLHQLVPTARAQLTDRHGRNQIRRDRIVNIDADQELVAANKNVTTSQQIPVQNVERLGDGITFIVKVAERPGRSVLQVERQVGRVSEADQHVFPRGVTEGEVQFAVCRNRRSARVVGSASAVGEPNDETTSASAGGGE